MTEMTVMYISTCMLILSLIAYLVVRMIGIIQGVKGDKATRKQLEEVQKMLKEMNENRSSGIDFASMAGITGFGLASKKYEEEQENKPE